MIKITYKNSKLKYKNNYKIMMYQQNILILQFNNKLMNNK